MATSQEPTETQAPYPSYNTLLAEQQWVRPAPNSGQLLFWALEGPLTKAVFVMHSPSSPDGPLESYYNQDNDSWHPISRLPITQPKVSSITVRVYELDEWDVACREEHEDPDADQDANDGADRQDFSVTVKPTGTGNEAFVTVHDFLEVVHPWLMSHKQDILTAKGMLEGSDQPLEDDTELMVNANGFESLMIERKEEWMAFKKKTLARTINISAS